MATQPSPLDDQFTLNIVAGHLRGFQPPDRPHDPQADWQLAYGVYTLGGIQNHGGRTGSLTICRKASADRGAVLQVDYQKIVRPDFSQQVAAQIHCRGDALSTPLHWTFSSQILNPSGQPVEHTALKKTAVADGRRIEITDGRTRRSIPAPSAYTVNWALFDAVGRLPRKELEPLRFTMLDHFDQLKPGQVLSYRKTADVPLGDRPLRLHAYDHLGRGVVPWIYWVDDQGRLLFAVSGLEAYLLVSFQTSPPTGKGPAR